MITSKPSQTTTILAAATIALNVLVAGCHTDSGNLTSRTEKRLGTQGIELDQVPIDIHRRAAQLLEDVRGTESAPGWDQADLAATARILERPDVSGPAYYEFRVQVEGEPAGHIVASAGDHDFPVTHWNFAGSSPTESLEELAREEIAAFVKVDTLSYVAKNSAGDMIANIGSLPPRIEGQDRAWLDEEVEDTTETWVPDQGTGDDEEAEKLEGSLEVEGPSEPRPIELSSWDSLQHLEAEYGESYGAMIESLRRQAAEEWDIEAQAAESGEGLVVGQPFELALLYSGANFDLVGEGADLVQADHVESAPGREVLILTAQDAASGEEIPLQVFVEYPNGQSEVILFVVLSEEDVASLVGSKAENVSWAKMGNQAAWGPWSNFFAGTHGDQRLYSQMATNTWPNTSGCWSGCGGTAWAMLFGWGDKQAGLGNAAWSHRWGLYRQNGGYGSNAIAPKYMDNGVRNMSWELRQRIGTFCAFGSGATFPWEMSDASGYLSGRTGASLSTNYNVLGIHTSGLRNKARDSIVYRDVPAIIGTGWLSHYPLAYGYRWRKRTVKKCFLFVCWNSTEYQRQFYVNQGWGGSGNGWVNAGTWFAGQLYAN